MKVAIAFPRLLPSTMVALAALLALKSFDLVRAAVPAQAEEAAPAKPAAASQAKPAASSHASAPSPVAAAPVSATPPKAETAVAAAPREPPMTDAERNVLLELRQRRQELEARDATLGAREAVLGAAERKIEGRVNDLQALQTKLEALETARKARDETNWHGMVKLYESMKPREAATIFNDLDMPVLLQVVDRMKEAKAAAVMAAMQPEKARQVTTELAQMRNRANADPGSTGGTPSANGGAAGARAASGPGPASGG